jgi:hypothetical protein
MRHIINNAGTSVYLSPAKGLLENPVKTTVENAPEMHSLRPTGTDE